MLLIVDCKSKEISRPPKREAVSGRSATAGGRAVKRPFLSSTGTRLRISSEERPSFGAFLIPILEKTNTDIRAH